MKNALIGIMITACCLAAAAYSSQKAEIVLKGGDIYTMESSQPWARGVAITGDKIIAVLDSDSAADRFIGADTRVVDLKGRFALPGFIDAQTHFSSAGALVNDVNLMTVADDEGLRKEIVRVVGIIGDGEWIVGGLWGAYEEWPLGTDAAGKPAAKRWESERRTIDDLTETRPCLLSSFDEKLSSPRPLHSRRLSLKP